MPVGGSQVGPQEAVTLAPLIYPSNSFWSVERPQLVQCCGSVPMERNLLISTELHSHTVRLRRTDAGAAARC